MFGTRRIGGDRAVVLAFVQEGATAWLSTEDGTTIDDASSSDSSSRYDVFIGFPAPTDEPDEVFVRNDDAEYACRFPAPTDIDVDCDLQ
jgi:hypothetical protein